MKQLDRLNIEEQSSKTQSQRYHKGAFKKIHLQWWANRSFLSSYESQKLESTLWHLEEQPDVVHYREHVGSSWKKLRGSWVVKIMALWRKDHWLDSEACWEAMGRESEWIILTVTFQNKHHQTAQCEAAAALSNSPVWINVMGSVWHRARGHKRLKTLHCWSPTSTEHYFG